ncbi:Transcriptional regulatory protein YehT [Blautia producta]|uniref:Stage 0 sporulation protein A homolog n=1 Tax=Blautia producta TaxID=33035 RepID=A0A4P6M100_9FIRM|nr:response regulator [Blautia producta]QBE97755.1 Transcriptional regulatory protein YehT [Blautia producta]
MKYKVLLVDDEKIYLTYLQKMIDWETMDCHICGYAHNGLEAVKKAEELSPDIIFMDISMSNMDGLEASSHLKENNSRAKIIIMTAYDEFSFAQKAIKLSVFDYLLKPFDEKELTDTLKKCIGEIDQERENAKNEQEIFLKEALDSGGFTLNDIETSAGHRYVVVLFKKTPEIPWKDKERFRKLLQEYLPEQTVESFFIGNQMGCGVIIHALSDKWMTPKNLKEAYGKILSDRPEEGFEWFAIGNIVDGIERLQETYQNANLVKENRIKMVSKVNCYEDVLHLEREFNMLNQDDVNVLIKAFEMKKYDKVDELIEKIFALSHKQMFSYQYVVATYYSVTTEIYGHYRYKETGDLEEMLSTSSNLLVEISMCSTKNQMLDIVKNYIYEIFSDCMGTATGNKKEVLAAKIEKYLQQHYADKSLSVSRITEDLYFENSYIRRVFKEQTGQTIIQRLEEIRLEKARQLLQEGVYKNSEIAEMTGFCDQQYFSKRFKLICGCTPSNYQKTKGK